MLKVSCLIYSKHNPPIPHIIACGKMNILFKILLAAVSTIFCVALVYTICRVWKRRISYHGPCNIACQDEPHNKKLRKVQDEMFEEVYNDNRA